MHHGKQHQIRGKSEISLYSTRLQCLHTTLQPRLWVDQKIPNVFFSIVIVLMM